MRYGPGIGSNKGHKIKHVAHAGCKAVQPEECDECRRGHGDGVAQRPVAVSHIRKAAQPAKRAHEVIDIVAGLKPYVKGREQRQPQRCQAHHGQCAHTLLSAAWQTLCGHWHVIAPEGDTVGETVK